MKLGSVYRLYTISQNTTLDVDDLTDDCMNFMRGIALDRETSEKLLKIEKKLHQTKKLKNIDTIYKQKKRKPISGHL